MDEVKEGDAIKTYKYPPECEVHGGKMHLEDIGRGKTTWVCDECEKGHQALFRAIFGKPVSMT